MSKVYAVVAMSVIANVPTITMAQDFIVQRSIGAIVLQSEPGAGARTAVGAAWLGKDTVAILEKDRGLVHVYTGRTGDLLASTREGDTLSRLSVGQGLAMGTTSQGILALDAKGSRLIEYHYDRGSLRVRRRFQGPEVAFGVCRLRDSYAVLGYEANHIVHRYRFSGTALNAFGEPLRDDSPLMARSLTRGSIACSASTDQVYVVSALLPEIRAYSSSGELVWQHRLADYRQITISRPTSTSVSFESPPGGHHQALGLYVLSGNRLLIQLGFTKKPTPGGPQYDLIETRILDASTGTEIGRSASLGRVLGSANDVAIVQASAKTGEIRIVSLTVKE